MTEMVGTARNAKAGAMLELDSGRTWYVQGLDSWPDGVDGLQVVVTGRATQQRYVPEATVNDDGDVSQGVAPGSPPDSVLAEATWHLSGSGEGVEPGPWAIRFADGSNNHTQVQRAPWSTSITWSYEPVEPEMSSSGVYTGGERAQGTLDDDHALELWRRVRALTSDPASQVSTRRKGTGSLDIIRATGAETVLIAPDQTAEFGRLLATWR